MNHADYDPEEAHKEALEETGFWGRRGAGAIIYARSTGRYLLQLRSNDVEQPGTWGVWGGAIDEGDEAEDCVRAEVAQETRYRGPMDVHFVVDYVDEGTGFRYSNFVAVVEDEFVPVLNWEGKDFGWFETGEWPEPMHFGLSFLLDNDPDPARTASAGGKPHGSPIP